MTHYTRSNGSHVEIATMGYHHLVLAHAKLQREEPFRTAEIDAMAAEIAKQEAEHVAEQAVAS